MESTGEADRVQASGDTAALLAGAHGIALLQRPGGVEAKGKGRLDTFWVLPADAECPAGTSSACAEESLPPPPAVLPARLSAPAAFGSLSAAACGVDIEAGSFSLQRSE